MLRTEFSFFLYEIDEIDELIIPGTSSPRNDHKQKLRRRLFTRMKPRSKEFDSGEYFKEIDQFRKMEVSTTITEADYQADTRDHEFACMSKSIQNHKKSPILTQSIVSADFTQDHSREIDDVLVLHHDARTDKI